MSAPSFETVTHSSQSQPHLFSLVSQSKKALHHGEQLCLRASTLSSASAQTAVDVLALDARLRWMTDAIVEQLKLAATVARNIELKRTQLEKRAQEWDALRTQRTNALDSILESLGSQVVPPDFHSLSADSSIFGSQNGSDDERDQSTPFADSQPGQSPTETLRNVLRNGLPKHHPTRTTDRSKWKTLRDFVDERAVDDVLDTIESDRNALDDILARTSDYPESLSNTISAIRSSVPGDNTLLSIDNIFASQESVSAAMAGHLESLTQHYDKMSSALQDIEAGEIFSDDDIQDMNRDMDELPAIVADLETNFVTLEASHGQLLEVQNQAQVHLDKHRATLDDLDELGEIIGEMLERQEVVETECTEHLTLLHTNLVAVEDLYHRFTSYQYAYSKLLVELARRKQYKEAAEKIVHGMMAQLEAMTEEEHMRREEFNVQHGDHLPSDVCLSVQNPPTRWEVVPWNDEPAEILPEVDADLLEEALARIRMVSAEEGGGLGASQSL